MPNQPSLFDSDLRYMLKSGPRDRPMSRRYTLFGVTALVLTMLVATWLASRPDASIDQIDTSHVKHDPLIPNSAGTRCPQKSYSGELCNTSTNQISQPIEFAQ